MTTPPYPSPPPPPPLLPPPPEPTILPPPPSSATAARNDRLGAMMAWCGILYLGPVLPAGLLLVFANKPGSRTRRHALYALLLWALFLCVWLPWLLVGVATSWDYPVFHVSTALVVVFVFLMLSVVGFIKAAQPIEPPTPTA